MNTARVKTLAATMLLGWAWMAGGADLRTEAQDDVIKYWVDKAVAQDPRMDTLSLQVSVHEGIVTLSGAVANLASRRYAVLETRKIDGVRGVIDQLTVEPALRSDADVSQDVRHRIAWDPALESQTIAVTCADGRVRRDLDGHGLPLGPAQGGRSPGIQHRGSQGRGQSAPGRDWRVSAV